MELLIVLTVALVVSSSAIVWLWRDRRANRAESARLAAELAAREKRPAIIAHEIRTPLALVRGAAELLAEQTPGPLNERQVGFVETITENVQQVIDIAENFISQVRLDDNPTLHTHELVDVREVVYEAARDMRRITSVPIRVDARGGMVPIYTEPHLIRQLVWNLVNNAIRHAGDGVTVMVRITPGDDGGALLSVGDTGSGMSERDLESLFTPFATGSSRRPGSGIGMLVTRKIVEAHGGNIMVDSEEGYGTAILVSLPRGEETR
ncbi:sensor histidine kinase [Flaviflexus equikiangi]|uniref:histidine kinase n=1 Tax=Flaviflexus equikiangi TaxID=2758573 RepID=A0ABS2TCU3_9ACTO|nr:HAMP domain-containing sensor histidine kinase [Flaviflexus equikiangi]MBM9432470.1 HAMP domain-containing histidine kinase [Flaviflexus equikiangi]